MTIHTTDILVSGGGLAGLIAAIAFAKAGFDTVCVDPNSAGARRPIGIDQTQ